MPRRRGAFEPACRLAALAGVVALLGHAAPGWPAPAPPPAPRAIAVVEYRIAARLDPAARTVTGTLHASWRNTSRTPAAALYLHLYLNAFESSRTTMMGGLREAAERWSARYPDEWGRIDLAAVRRGGVDVTDQLELVQPDDGNPDDRTLARLPLPRPAAPRERVELEIDFVARLPRAFMRTGHAAPYFFAGQWFPKLAVFRNGRWSAHQYDANSEFFADFGTYDVTLTVPSTYVVGHTGVARAEHDNGDGTKTLEIHAADVHDFAWTADPRFQVVEREIAGTRVRLLLQPHHRDQSHRYFRALRAAMDRYARWLGPYPYPQLTVVDPGPGGFATAGMEYPMLITVGTAWWMPDGLRLPELLAVHEFGHQYWYGMVANDEAEEAWLDEGINSYFEGLIMDEAYGAGSYVDLLGLQVGAVAMERARYLAAGQWDPITRPSFKMLDRESYASAAYSKTALALRTLDQQLGDGRLRQALREYFLAWRFRHPRGEDLRTSLEVSSGERLAPLLGQLLDGTGVLDYAVARIEVRTEPPSPPPAGEGGGPRRAEPPRYHTEVVIERRGDVRLPVDIVVAFEDGGETRASWDGEDRWYRLDITSTQPAAYAVVDPDFKLPLDVDRLNNSRLTTPGTRGVIRLAGRWGLWLQGVLYLLSGL